jgi:hypothetical protein
MWLVRACDVTYSDGWHDSIMYVWHDSFKRVTWLIRVCDVTYSYMWHDSIMHEAWQVLIRMCDGYDWVMLHIRIRTSGSFVCVTCVWLVLIIMCDSYNWVMAHIRICHTYKWEHVLISMCDQCVTRSHSYVWLTRTCDSHDWVMAHIRMRTCSHSHVWFVCESFSFVCVTRMLGSYHTYEWERVLTRMYEWERVLIRMYEWERVLIRMYDWERVSIRMFDSWVTCSY